MSIEESPHRIACENTGEHTVQRGGTIASPPALAANVGRAPANVGRAPANVGTDLVVDPRDNPEGLRERGLLGRMAMRSCVIGGG
ncbi:MAG: hypothetical protein Q8Q09_10885 [Deltaproteobacteria bacterium]|nr:hypothetical protein [Deltaproteobacteria bacterium]